MIDLFMKRILLLRIKINCGFSSAPNTKVPEQLVPDPAEARQKIKLLWISCGASDRLVSFSKRTHDYLQENNVPHIYYIEPGVHDFKVWKNGR